MESHKNSLYFTNPNQFPSFETQEMQKERVDFVGKLILSNLQENKLVIIFCIKLWMPAVMVEGLKRNCRNLK
jgi:hypothetical protein